MQLRDWRNECGKTLRELALALGLGGSNPSRQAQRTETGEVPTDADMVERIVALTGGAVTAEDMHTVRLAWLKANRPEKFEAQPVPEAAE